MLSSNMSVAKSVGIGLALGTVAAVAGTKLVNGRSRRACKKSMARCMRNAEDVMEGIASMMK